MQLQDPVLFATLLRRVFNTNPLTRSWQLIAAGLGWPTAPVGSLLTVMLTVSLRKLLQMIDRVVMNMPVSRVSVHFFPDNFPKKNNG